MSWRLEGTYLENCNCEVVCPCSATSLALPADNERCQVVLAFNVRAGEIEGVDVSGRAVVLVADTPQQMTDGNWRLGVFFDDGASEDQAGKLQAVFGGQLGGPPAGLVPLLGDMLGMESAPITYTDDGFRHSVRVGDAIDIEIEDWVPEGNDAPTMLTGIVHPAAANVTVARASRGRVDAFGLSFANAGKNGHSAPFSWAA